MKPPIRPSLIRCSRASARKLSFRSPQWIRPRADPDNVIIGASVIGPHASDLLAELTMAVELGLTAEQLGDVIHPHPSLSEAVMEAAHDVHGMSIHK